MHFKYRLGIRHPTLLFVTLNYRLVSFCSEPIHLFSPLIHLFSFVIHLFQFPNPHTATASKPKNINGNWSKFIRPRDVYQGKWALYGENSPVCAMRPGEGGGKDRAAVAIRFPARCASAKMRLSKGSTVSRLVPTQDDRAELGNFQYAVDVCKLESRAGGRGRCRLGGGDGRVALLCVIQTDASADSMPPPPGPPGVGMVLPNGLKKATPRRKARTRRPFPALNPPPRRGGVSPPQFASRSRNGNRMAQPDTESWAFMPAGCA